MRKWSAARAYNTVRRTRGPCANMLAFARTWCGENGERTFGPQMPRRPTASARTPTTEEAKHLAARKLVGLERCCPLHRPAHSYLVKQPIESHPPILQISVLKTWHTTDAHDHVKFTCMQLLRVPEVTRRVAIVVSAKYVERVRRRKRGSGAPLLSVRLVILTRQ